MCFSYDYFPYNDTIAAGLYDNLYVRIFGIQSSVFGPNCKYWVMFWEFLRLRHVPRLNIRPRPGNTDDEKGGWQLHRSM